MFSSYVCNICGERCLQGKKDEDSIKLIPICNFILCMGVEIGKEKLWQTLLTSLLKKITRAKRKDVLQKEVEDINEITKQKAPMPERVKKCPIGHPKKIVATLQFEKQIKHEEGEEEVANKQNGSKQKH